MRPPIQTAPMTEEHWRETNTAPRAIENVIGRVSERKLRLFACAACRRILHVMPYEASRRAVEISERYADGQASEQELENAEREARELAEVAERRQAFGWNAARTAALAAHERAYQGAERAAASAADGDLVREIFGNPFQLLRVSDAILSWQNKTVVRQAQAAYDERLLPPGTLDKTRLMILADALEEAGCDDEQILSHLRSGKEHYRGCFVLDALLGKE